MKIFNKGGQDEVVNNFKDISFCTSGKFSELLHQKVMDAESERNSGVVIRNREIYIKAVREFVGEEGSSEGVHVW